MTPDMELVVITILMERAIVAKFAYAGLGLSGKTTNINYIASVTRPDRIISADPVSGRKGPLSYDGEEGRKHLFHFEFEGLELRGLKVRAMLECQPGMVSRGEQMRRSTLRGADVIIFVMDSQVGRRDTNIQAWEQLREDLDVLDMPFDDQQIIIQANKRDLANILSVDEMLESIGAQDRIVFEAIASTGAGVLDTLKGATKLAYVAAMK